MRKGVRETGTGCARAPGRKAILGACAVVLALGCAGDQVDSAARAHPVALAEGEAALAEGNPDAAAVAFRAALAADPREARALHGLARAHLERGDGEAALRALLELEEFHGEEGRRRAGADRCRVLTAAARQRLARGDSGPALEVARQLPVASCEPEESARLLGRALLAEARRQRAEHKDAEAIALFRAAAEADPSEPDAFVEAAELLLRAGRRDEAVELLSTALLEHPRDRDLRDRMVEALAGR
jgi:tetratricopeptide (TPR) repeat protein